jgi:hypothetical protein
MTRQMKGKSGIYCQNCTITAKASTRKRRKTRRIKGLGICVSSNQSINQLIIVCCNALITDPIILNISIYFCTMYHRYLMQDDGCSIDKVETIQWVSGQLASRIILIRVTKISKSSMRNI